ncbi:hypothetical protein LTS18_007984 [Coniosporium uncinatum]|uniref:Uncharacterized protein n=1 Tax=Coniosporium uncinatum TaxID=93489 RepID=A0ACC3D2C2_9PEZI|nr:hypothetical protein LTS18_007984 [Coniosporium uncinatum]
MDFVKGQRFHIPLEDEDIDEPVERSPPKSAFDFVGDIQERQVATPKPPSAPMPKSTSTGFPEHKKRSRSSAFKQQRQASQQDPNAVESRSNGTVPPPPSNSSHGGESFAQRERREIDEQNQRQLASMSAAEIEQEQQDLFQSLDPSMIQRLLRRANIDEPTAPPTSAPEQCETRPERKTAASKKVTFDTSEPLRSAEVASPQNEAPEDVEKLAPTSSKQKDEDAQPELPSIHWPRRPNPPDLDPYDPNFLESLHEKYFPDLAHDPSKLDWMKPADDSDTTSPYHPSQTSLDASSLRFDFRGALLPPRLARQIPVTAGLHHHGDAPEAAGYTVPELARLARSQFAPQRCIAYQTLGRILYRLGLGQFGDETDKGSEGEFMCKGLWECMEEGRVLDALTEEANKSRGHTTAIAYAQEAVWNWKRGGGRKRKAG